MKANSVVIRAVICLILSQGAVFAADKDDAAKAARQIIASLQARQYDHIWSDQTSDFFKKRTTKDSFLANMSMGRQQLGDAKSTQLIDMAYSQSDPASGYTGEIYGFNYLDTYAAGKFYERIVVVKESDGVFRLSGIWGAPAPPAPTPQ